MFLNVNPDLEMLSLSDLILNGTWNIHSLRNLFVENLIYLTPNLGLINAIGNNHWVWYSKSQSINTFSEVYQHLNHNIAPQAH